MIDELSKRLVLAEATPAPPKMLAGSARALTKAEDVNPGVANVLTKALPTSDMADAYLNGLSEPERALEITKAALRLPIQGLQP